MNSTHWIVITALSGAIVFGRHVTAEDLPADVRAALEANEESLNPIELTWDRTRQSRLGQRALMKVFEWPDYARIDFFAKTTVVFRWQDGMQYQLTEGQIAHKVPKKPTDQVKIVPYGWERAFNGSNIYVGEAEEARLAFNSLPSMTVDSLRNPKHQKPDNHLFRPDFLSAAGYWVPERFSDLGEQLQHSILHLIESGGTIASVAEIAADGGTPLLRVVIDYNSLRHVFDLDPAKGYAVRRREDTVLDTGEKARVVILEDLRQVGDLPLWLPWQCKTAHYTWASVGTGYDNDPIVDETLTLTKLSTERMPIEYFMLKYTTPGTLVTDFTLVQGKTDEDSGVQYKVPANLEDLDKVIAQASGRIETNGLLSRRYLLILANVAAVVLLIVAIMIHRRRWTA